MSIKMLAVMAMLVSFVAGSTAFAAGEIQKSEVQKPEIQKPEKVEKPQKVEKAEKPQRPERAR